MPKYINGGIFHLVQNIIVILELLSGGKKENLNYSDIWYGHYWLFLSNIIEILL